MVRKGLAGALGIHAPLRFYKSRWAWSSVMHFLENACDPLKRGELKLSSFHSCKVCFCKRGFRRWPNSGKYFTVMHRDVRA